MTSQQLRDLQAPLKSRYRDAPASARSTLRASGTLDLDALECRLDPSTPNRVAGLHPATGGDGQSACSGDMLLEALVACSGVTLCAVATALELPVRGGTVQAEGDLDFRGTLGTSKETPVGFQAIRLQFTLDSDAHEEQLQKLLALTERYCVVYQTLRSATEITTTLASQGEAAP